MKFDNFFKTKRMVVGCLSAAALAAVACADGRGVPTSPSVSAAGPGLLAAAAGNEGNVRPPVAQSLLASSRRSGALQVTKECSEYTGQVGSFCTITSSNVKAIEVGSRIVYGHGPGATSLDSDIVLDTPGPGNNAAIGHCALDFATGIGLCTFSGGTGKFNQFEASANVSYLGGPNWAWNGTYSFSPHD
jgi:hypothetical protein